jgi:hypothetical protein
MKTMADLEMESPAEFRNPVRTPEQEATLEKMHAERKAHEALHMAVDKIETEYVCPPIPVRSMDWQATRKGYDEGDLIGRGATEQDAINDLLEQEGE